MLERISFIGVDEKTDLDAIIKINDDVILNKFPLEFGVLFSHSKQEKGNNRYPSTSFVKYVGEKLQGKVLTSLHLCGSSVKEFLELKNEYLELVKHYDRIQLNFRVSDPDDSSEILELADKIMSASEWYDKPLIIQYNENKKNLIDFMMNEEDLSSVIHILFDASGGYGVELVKPIPVFDNTLCGYAGAIGPDTVQTIMDRINDVNYYDSIFYIDMESKIRTDDDWFSVDKCKEVVNAVDAWYRMAHKWNRRPTR